MAKKKLPKYKDGGEVNPYQAKDKADYDYRQRMHNDSLDAYINALNAIKAGHGYTPESADNSKESVYNYGARDYNYLMSGKADKNYRDLKNDGSISDEELYIWNNPANSPLPNSYGDSWPVNQMDPNYNSYKIKPTSYLMGAERGLSPIYKKPTQKVLPPTGGQQKELTDSEYAYNFSRQRLIDAGLDPDSDFVRIDSKDANPTKVGMLTSLRGVQPIGYIDNSPVGSGAYGSEDIIPVYPKPKETKKDNSYADKLELYNRAWDYYKKKGNRDYTEKDAFYKNQISRETLTQALKDSNDKEEQEILKKALDLGIYPTGNYRTEGTFFAFEKPIKQRTQAEIDAGRMEPMAMRGNPQLPSMYSRDFFMPYVNVPDARLTEAARLGYPVAGTGYASINNKGITKAEYDEIMRKKEHNRTRGKSSEVDENTASLPEYNLGGALTDLGMGLANATIGQVSQIYTGKSLSDNLGYEFKTGAGQTLDNIYDKGAGAMQTAVGFVPGVGQLKNIVQSVGSKAVQSIIGNKAIDNAGLEEMQTPAVQSQPIVSTSTPEAQYVAQQRTPFQPLAFQNGGYLPKYFMGGNMYEKGGLIEYKGPKHEQGGIPVAPNGLPVDRNNAVGEVEGGETAHSGYIFSDTLKTKEGKTFADASKELAAKFNIDNLEDYV
jgi:hypothetical protein